MSKSTILFLTNSEFGQATVILAVAHEFLIRRSYDVHIASFSELESAVSQLNAQAAVLSKQQCSEATFHPIAGQSMLKKLTGGEPLTKSFSAHGIGVFGAPESYAMLPNTLAPWKRAEYIEIYQNCVEIIKTVQPTIVALDPLFSQAVDACDKMKCPYVVLGPNTLKDHVIQPWLANLWKYPILCSGYSYPLPFRYILPNIYLTLRLGATLAGAKEFKAINEMRHANGLEGPYPGLRETSDEAKAVLIPSRLEHDFPSFVPANFTLCGPMLRACRPIAEEDPDLAKWLAARPTVLINLGSHVCFDVKQATELANGLRKLLDARPDIQVLWKLKRVPSEDVKDFVGESLGSIRHAMDEGRVRIMEWLPVEPICILQSGNVVCMVHHGGANSYHEAIRAGVAQIILPVWFDTYDFAARVEWLGIGAWASKKSAPSINGPELGEAFIHVLASEASAEIQAKAMRIALKLGPKEGRAVACEKIIELIEG